MPLQKINDNVEIYYQEKGVGQPLVLIHGTGFNSTCWTKVIDALAEKFRVIIYDRRSYGQSSGPLPPPKEYYATHGSDLCQFLEKLDLTNVILFGWSAGGIVSYHALLKDASRVQKLICYEPPLHAVKNIDGYLFKHFLKINFSKIWGGTKKGALAFTKMVGYLKNGKKSLDYMEEDFENIYSKDSHTAMAEFASGTGEELKPEQLQLIKIPITFMNGSLSADIFHKATKRQTKLFNTESIVMNNSGHFAQIENPYEFTATLLQKNHIKDRLLVK